MGFRVHKVQVWSGEISDRPGAAAAKLEVLAQAGTNLEYIFTRPNPREPDGGVLYIAPIHGPEQTQAARVAGLNPASEVAMLCVEGQDRAGLGFEIMRHLAVAGINLRGLSFSSVGDRFAAYLAFDNHDAATQAVRVLAEL